MEANLCSLKRENINAEKNAILSKFRFKNKLEMVTITFFHGHHKDTPLSQIIPDFSSTELNIMGFTDLLLQ